MAADPVLVSALLRNLIDNALRYSPPMSTVQVTFEGADAQGRLGVSVEDSGPGLPPPLLQRLGERFFRARLNDASGSGLGWSIVRRIAAALDLVVQVDRSPTLGGLRVRIGWTPVSAPARPQGCCAPGSGADAPAAAGALAAPAGEALRMLATNRQSP